jgi:pimeloyl-ACP methyl ester carboxylesterase
MILAIQTAGEENNLARRFTVQAASRFSEIGFATLIFDPFGVGDSAGRTSDARLQDWRSDLLRVSHQMRVRYDVPFYIWGTRLGTLLATDLLISQSDNTAGLLMWAPLAHGRTWVDLLKSDSDSPKEIGRPRISESALETALSDAIKEDSALLSGPQSIVSDENSDKEDPLCSFAGTMFRRSMLTELQNLTLAPLKQHPNFGTTAKVALIGLEPTNPHRFAHGESRVPPALEAIAATWRGSGYQVYSSAIFSEYFWSSGRSPEPEALYGASEKWLLSTLEGGPL